MKSIRLILFLQKRVNTLTKKFEWDYFEALTTQRLPNVEQKEHRKKVGSLRLINLSRWRNGLARLQQWQCYLQGPRSESHL